MGEAFITRRGGSGGYTPKIYVQTSQPAGKAGEFWVQDSGYTLDTVVANVDTPSSLSVNALYLQISPSVSRYNWIIEKKLNLSSGIVYGRAYLGGWRNAAVWIYSGGWINISVQSNKLFRNTSSSSGELVEVDPVTLLDIRVFNTGTSVGGLGGIRGRMFIGTRSNTINEIDALTLVQIRSVSRNHTDFDGMAYRMYLTFTGIYEVDINTFATIRSDTSGNIFETVGCTESRLYASKRVGSTSHPICELDPNTFAITHIGSINWSVAKALGSTSTQLFVAGPYIQELDVNTLAATRNSVHTNVFSVGGTK